MPLVESLARPSAQSCHHHFVAISATELSTLLRPVVVRLEHSLQRLMQAGLAVPTRTVPRIQSAADGSGRQWTEAEVDFSRLRIAAMSALEGTRELQIAEAVIAETLGLEPEVQSPDERRWSPQGQVVDVFLE